MLKLSYDYYYVPKYMIVIPYTSIHHHTPMYNAMSPWIQHHLPPTQ